MEKAPVASDIQVGNTDGMEVLMTFLIITALCLAAGFWGADSRPLDLHLPKPTRWWLATPRN